MRNLFLHNALLVRFVILYPPLFADFICYRRLSDKPTVLTVLTVACDFVLSVYLI